jgi:hypothetical protein
MDDKGSGHLSVVTCVEVNEQVYQHIHDNLTIITDETACEMRISHGKNRCKNDSSSNRKQLILKE